MTPQWQKAHGVDRPKEEWVWVKTGPPHDTRNPENKEPYRGYDTNVKHPPGRAGVYAMDVEVTELWGEFAESVRLITYKQWVRGLRGHEPVS